MFGHRHLAAVLATLLFCSHAWADFFVVEYHALVYLKPAGGSAGAITEFGMGTSMENRVPLFRGLPNSPDPDQEIFVGLVRAGTVLHFYQKTEWNSATHWAFSNGDDEASLIAFYDGDNSLGYGGSAVERTGRNTWLFHLDDAASLLHDDDDNDVLIQIRLVPLRLPAESSGSIP
jgi:hypothetical protein